MAPHPTRVVFFLAIAITAAAVDSTATPATHPHLRLEDRIPSWKHSSVLSSPSPDAHCVIYEEGIVVQTVLDENRLGISIYSTLPVPNKDFLYAVDSTASQLLKVRLPIDQKSAVARRVAGDGKGRTGYNDGWGEVALLDHPKGLTVDGDGNVYVADVRNRVIRKISPAGYVSTVAGQPNKTGRADGDGRNALFSSDFTLAYLPRTCSLLISDRGNERLRMIQLKTPPLKCDYESRASGHMWKTVTYLFGFLVTILSAALGIALVQKWELQRICVSMDDEGDLNGYHGGGGPSNLPFLTTKPRLIDSTATLRRGRSLPDDLSVLNFLNRTDLMDFSDSPSYETQHSRPTNRLRHDFLDSPSYEIEHSRPTNRLRHAFDGSGDSENDDLVNITSDSEDYGRTNRDIVRIRSLEQDLLSNPESMLTDPNDSLSRRQDSSSALQAPDRRTSIDEAINRAFVQFRLGNER